jgi:prepilin-type N-terminal cleavage/methylation domain-containing protein
MKPQLTNKLFIKKNQQGFTLIEILIALFLVSIVMGLAITTQFSSSQEIESEVKDIERAINFQSDEAAFRNTVTRLHITLSHEPQYYAVEYGPSSQFVLPAKTESDMAINTKEEEEKKKKELSDFNMKFARISEFQESNKELNANVKIVAVGNTQASKLQTNGEFSVYSFPSGERDEAFIVLAQESTMATLSTQAFSSKIVHNYYHLDKTKDKELQEAYQVKAKELFEEWRKEKK